MSQERSGDPIGQNRLFHAMVLMGGSIALGCGGMSAGTEDDDSGLGGTGSLSGAGSAGSPAAGTGGTGSGSGGTASSGTGGAIVLPPIAGTGSVDPDPTCPPAQRSCADGELLCVDYTYQVPATCGCDRTRPLSASECPAGTVFACHAGGRAPDGTALPQVVPFMCSCVRDWGNCDAECSEVAPSAGMCSDIYTPETRSVLCKCAVIVLR